MINSFDINIINFLINYGIKNKWEKRFTICSCLVYKNKKYGCSKNNYYETNPLTKKYNYPNLHAEIGTLYSSSKKLNITNFKNSSLYIIGLSKSYCNNFTKSSYPCNNCFKVINNFNIKRIVYIESKNNKDLIIKEKII